MWILTSIGFFSVVQKPRDSFLTIRSRVKSDLDRLKKGYMPQLSETTTSGGTDYPYRATISHEEFARGIAKLIKDIRYTNFKNEVLRKMGSQREQTYSKVWHTLQELEGLTNET